MPSGQLVPSSSDNDDGEPEQYVEAEQRTIPPIAIVSPPTSEYSASPGEEDNYMGAFYSSSQHHTTSGQSSSGENETSEDFQRFSGHRRFSEQREYMYYGALAHGAAKDMTGGDDAPLARPSTVSMERPAVPHEV